MTRFAWISIGLWSAFVAGGCAGTLDDPNAFSNGGTGGSTTTAETVLAESCGTTGCHDAGSQAQAGLDLVSPGVWGRLVDVNSIAVGCTDEVLVVAGDPDSSYLLDKVLNIPGICGLQMPIVGMLAQEEIDILRQWIVNSGSSGDPAPSQPPSPTDDAATILAESCGTTACHDDSGQAQAGLDLRSSGVEARLVDVNSIAVGCTDEVLVVAGDPENSYLLDKVLNVPGICGLRMPTVGMLEEGEIEVLRQWIVDLGGS